MYRKYEYIFIYFSSLPLIRKYNMTLKPQVQPVVTSSAESPAVGNIWNKRIVGSHMSSLCRGKVEERVSISHEGSRSEPSPAGRKGAEFAAWAKAAFGWCDEHCYCTTVTWIQSFACAPALPPHLIYSGCKSTLLPSAVPWLVHARSD